jgi:hypothetical protein
LCRKPPAHIVPMTETRAQPACHGCGAIPPPSDEDSESSTLLSMRFGWRVVRRPDGLGGVTAEWRCPSCWHKYKESRPARSKVPIKRGP